MRNTRLFSNRGGGHSLFLISFMILVIAFFFADFTTYSNYIAYPFFFLWAPFILNRWKLLPMNDRSFVGVSFALLAIMLFYWLIGYSSMEVGLVLRETNWLIAGVISVYVIKMFSERELRNVYILIVLAVILLLSIYISLGNILVKIDDQEDAILIASAWYGSLFMLLSGLSFVFLIHVKSLIPRIISLSVFLLTLYLNFFILQRGTNVIFTLAEIAIIVLFTFKNKSLVYILSAIILGLSIYVYNSDILISFFDWFADVIPSERLAVRFREISTALAFEDLSAGRGSLSGRNELMLNSWNTFTSSIGSFLFGVGEHSGINTMIGHHSFFLDTLARYGIIGGLLVFVYFKKQYQIIMSYLNIKTEWTLYMQCAVIFMFYVLRNFIGVLAYALVNIVILVLFPLTYQLIHYYTTKTKVNLI